MLYNFRKTTLLPFLCINTNFIGKIVVTTFHLLTIFYTSLINCVTVNATFNNHIP